MKYIILILLPLNEQQQNKLCSVAQNSAFTFCSVELIDAQRISEADIIIGNPPPDLLVYAKKLKWLQLITAGADAYLRPGLINDDVILTSANGAYGEAQSEFMLATLLSLYKKLHLYRDNQYQRIWQDEGNERMLHDATALIIGMGNIGANFAKRLKAFGVYVIGVRRSNLHPSEYADELYSVEKLDELLPRADIISLTLPATIETNHILNERTLSLMKHDVVLINAGRGKTVDTDALCNTLEQNRLSGAALDVMEIEPLPPSHKLWHMSNVIITPHVAGRDFLPCTLEKTVSIVADNLRAYLSGKPLRNMVSHTTRIS